MNSNRALLAAAGALVLVTSAAVLAQTAAVSAADGVNAPDTIATVTTAAKGNFTNAAFSQPARPAGGEPSTAKTAADPGVVVTYANNRSSVVVTGHNFGLDRPVAPAAPTKHAQ